LNHQNIVNNTLIHFDKNFSLLIHIVRKMHSGSLDGLSAKVHCNAAQLF